MARKNPAKTPSGRSLMGNRQQQSFVHPLTSLFLIIFSIVLGISLLVNKVFLGGTIPYPTTDASIVSLRAVYPSSTSVKDGAMPSIEDSTNEAYSQDDSDDDDSDDRFQCLSTKTDFLDILNSTGQTYILMPAKGGGTSIKEFAKECMSDVNNATHPYHRDNFINTPNKTLLPFLTDALYPPKLVASHLLKGEPLLDLIRYSSPRKTLIIYVYRDETDRILSSIRYIIDKRICIADENRGLVPPKWALRLSRLKKRVNRKQCVIDEEPFLTEFVQNNFTEVGFSVARHLSCEFWQEVQETGPPALLFVHYSELDRMQDALAKHYCPHVSSKQQNTRPTEKDPMARDHYIKTKYNNTETGKQELVRVEDWVKAKKSAIEFSLKLISGGSCKRETRLMEEAMMSCPDKLIKVNVATKW